MTVKFIQASSVRAIVFKHETNNVKKKYKILKA